MKKRWIWVFLAAIITVVVLVETAKNPEAVRVEVVTIKPQRVEQTVSCMGVIEAADGHGVFVPVSCLVTEVKVREGQRVKKGDVLAVIDREATSQMLVEPTQLVALAALDDEITAQEDGIVVSVPAQVGQMLENGTPCVVVAYDEDVWIRIAIREKDLRVLRQGMVVRVSGDGLVNSPYVGTLTEIASAAQTDLGGGTVVEGEVTLRDGDVDSSFRLGLTTKVAVVTDVIDNGIVIPFEAVVSDESGSYVYVAEKGTARRYNLSEYRQISSGILLEDRSLENVVVITTPDRISDGCTISVEGASA